MNARDLPIGTVIVEHRMWVKTTGDTWRSDRIVPSGWIDGLFSDGTAEVFSAPEQPSEGSHTRERAQ